MTVLAFLMLTLFADEAKADNETKPYFLSHVADWPDDLGPQFEAFSSDQRTYATMMLSESWPNEGLGSQKTMTVFRDKVRVKQVVGKDELVAELEDGPVWIDGVDTSNLSDDAVVDFSGFAFIVDGTRTYTTVIGGTKTVKKLRGFSVRKADEFIQSVLALRGYRMFKVERVEGNPWFIGTVTSITKLSVSLQKHGEKKPWKLAADHFDEAGQEWLSKKENIKAMQKTKREVDAAEKLKLKTEKAAG